MSRYSRIILIGLIALFLAACTQATTQAPTSPTTSAPLSAPTSAPTSAPPTAVAAVNQRTDAELSAKLDDFLTKISKDHLFSGIVTVTRGQGMVFQKGYGFADRAKHAPFSPQTIFRIGEMSMQFTAAATLLLEQQQKLTVQDPLCTYIERCPEAWKSVTLHHLLSHTSGIPDYDGGALENNGATTDQILDLIRDKPLDFVPGSERGFSHSNFVLLGRVIERASGQSYGDFMRQQIFAPVGMQHSGYGDPPDGRAIGYENAGDQQATFDASVLGASGGLYTTSDDMLRWIEGLYGMKLLNRTQLEKMLTPHARFGDQNENGSGYGIVLETRDGYQGNAQCGQPSGFVVCAKYLPDTGVSIIVLANQDNVDAQAIKDTIYKIVLGIS